MERERYIFNRRNCACELNSVYGERGIYITAATVPVNKVNKSTTRAQQGHKGERARLPEQRAVYCNIRCRSPYETKTVQDGRKSQYGPFQDGVVSGPR